MKPIVKICLVLSGILFLLGITGVGVGMTMGASPSRILYSEHFPGWFFLHPDSGLSEIADPFDDLDDIPRSPETILPVQKNTMNFRTSRTFS